MRNELLRIIDANLNRLHEGLRVCEEIVRFIIEDERLTAEYKNLRHSILRNLNRNPKLRIALLRSRDSLRDVGKELPNPTRHKVYKDVFSGNIQRVKESLRVIEEFSKIFDPFLSRAFSRTRFKTYELEKKTLERF